ncbi:permease [Longirhabdus pacifica]|uniref:permease n=1 Tax=Longirhabdus pacifica TaxID=2305227 RepID=UPI001F0CD0A1|nr:permease [Longirhabdus pacifica]
MLNYFLSGQLLPSFMMIEVPASFKQLNTIFLSILIEAIPFVLIGVLIAGFIQIFITEEHIRRWIPKNRFLAVVMSCVVGAFFPACECGIVPIVRRLVKKSVPIYAAVGFMLTGPLINPIVILSTYMAFGNDVVMASLRMGIGFVAALLIALVISYVVKGNQLKHVADSSSHEHHGHEGDDHGHHHHDHHEHKESMGKKLHGVLKHSIDEFFDVAKFLILGAFIASAIQVYVPTSSLLLFGENALGSTIVMMGLAYFLSLCSEADAFIGASFRGLFPTTSILAFLVYGPMIDLKNTIMLLSAFKAKFVFSLLFYITCIVFICITMTYVFI